MRVCLSQNHSHCRVSILPVDPHFAGLQELGLRSYMCSPLVVGGRVFGSLCLGSREKDQFSPEEIDLSGQHCPACGHCPGPVQARDRIAGCSGATQPARRPVGAPGSRSHRGPRGNHQGIGKLHLQRGARPSGAHSRLSRLHADVARGSRLRHPRKSARGSCRKDPAFRASAWTHSQRISFATAACREKQ